MIQCRFLLALTCLLSASVPVQAAHVRGSSSTKPSIGRRRTQGNNNNNMNMNNDKDTTTETAVTANTEDSIVQPPANVYVPPGGAGTPAGSLAAEGVIPGGAGATGSGIGSSTLAVCPHTVYTDVVIVGAGAAGLAAAHTLQQADLDYVLLESTGRVGGRVRSTDFGVPTNRWKVEDGANWIYGDVQGNPLLDWVDMTQFYAPFNDYYAYTVYNGTDGSLVDPELYAQEMERFLQAVEETISDLDNQWQQDHDSFPDYGVTAKFAQHGWSAAADTPLGNVDFTIQWDYLDWEYAMADTSVRYFPTYPYESLMAADPRGFDFLLQTFAQQNLDTTRLRLRTRVRGIDYNYNLNTQGATTYKARVHTTNGTQCTDYIAQRVITTVSPGVLQNELIQFTPPLQYKDNPLEMGQYVKLYYQFDTQWWDDNEFIRVVPPNKAQRGKCHHWQNMNYFMPGSNILRCEIMTEAFHEILQGQRSLTDEQVSALLDPLRTVYGADTVGTPIDTYVTTLHLDVNFGFGAYANWKIGYNFTQYAQYYGGMDDLTPYCQHNGCNARQEWILHFSGSARCYDQAETVHGAYFAGELSAHKVLRELGYDVKENGNNPCDANWAELKRK